MALLGRRDEPTDGVEEYCRYLGAALEPNGYSLELVRVAWAEKGWRAAFDELRGRAAEWHGAWVLVQYAALAWSLRGFPLRVPRLLRLLKRSGARCAIVFHDAQAFGGQRFAHRLRRTAQLSVMRKAFREADLAIFTVPAEKLAWLPSQRGQALFIPVGANLPSPERVWSQPLGGLHASGTVSVFSVTEEGAGLEEATGIAAAVRYAAERLGKLRLVVLGRGAEAVEKMLRASLRDSPVEIAVFGVLSGEEVVSVLGSSDVMLFLRGPISTRRGSAIAGIACGLPVIACAGPETASPITEAGVVLLPPGNKDGFGPELHSVLSDSAYRASLAARSRRAQEEHFSWRAIAEKYAAAMHK